MNLVLFINGLLGLQVLEYVASLSGITISNIFVNSDAKRSSDYIAQVKVCLEKNNIRPKIIRWDKNASKTDDFGVNLEQSTIGVSVLFGHILPQRMIENFSMGILNLHTSLLPIGRGADPIPWSIINKQPQGITIHLIDQQIDTGDIIFQKEIRTTIDMSAGDIYRDALSELLIEFSRIFPMWLNGELQPSPQSGGGISNHKSGELNWIIGGDEVDTFENFVRRLQATTFSDGRKPLFEDNLGKIWECTFGISEQVIDKQ